MKHKQLFILGFTFSFLLGGDHSVFSDIRLDEALVTAKLEGKPVMLKFHAVWCHFCNKMDNVTFIDENVKNTLEEFISLKLDVDKTDGLSAAHYYKVIALPTIIILNSKGEKVYHQQGYHSPEQMQKVLKKINAQL